MSIQLTCPYCTYSRKVPREKIPVGAKWATCPRCHQRFELSSLNESGRPVSRGIERKTGFDTFEDDPQSRYERSGAPWENRSELGLWQAIYHTFKTVLFSPETLFKRLTFQSGIADPLAFGILVGSMGTMVGLFWQFLIWSRFTLFSEAYIIGQFTFGVIYLIITVFTPIFWIFWICLSSAVIHLLLWIVRGGRNGFEATLRVVSYSQAAQIWSLIPFVGGVIGWIWQLVVQIIGLRQIHETSYLRITIALLIPVALIFLLMAIIAAGIMFLFR
ncbi:MAG: YIP1 family protein [Desulfatiglandaceae bacterium]